MDLRSEKRNHVEGEAVSLDGGIDREKIKWLSSESQLSENNSLAKDGRTWSGSEKV